MSASPSSWPCSTSLLTSTLPAATDKALDNSIKESETWRFIKNTHKSSLSWWGEALSPTMLASSPLSDSDSCVSALAFPFSSAHWMLASMLVYMCVHQHRKWMNVNQTYAETSGSSLSLSLSSCDACGGVPFSSSELWGMSKRRQMKNNGNWLSVMLILFLRSSRLNLFRMADKWPTGSN